MLTLINEDLMSFATTEMVDRKTGRSYTKIQVMTSNKLQQYEDRINAKQYGGAKRRPTTKSTAPNRIESHSDSLLSINREILRISAPIANASPNDSSDTNYDRIIDFECPMSINITYQNRFQPQVDIRCHTHGEDRANVYVIAFPFNGMIRPLEENPCYRIYKGLIASSAKPFFFNNRKYRKVLYLIIEVNKNLYREDHPHHKDTVEIDLESFALFDDRENPGKRKTNYEKCRLTFLPQGNYIPEWTYNVIDEPVMMNVEAGRQLWPTYQFERKGNQPKSQGQPGKKLKNGQKPVTVEGDMLVTTNRHGIRKEMPMPNRNRPNFNGGGKRRPQTTGKPKFHHDKDLESMMQASGIYDEPDIYRGKKNGGKKNKRRH